MVTMPRVVTMSRMVTMPPPWCPAQVCWRGPEPQRTPNHIFLPPNGSPTIWDLKTRIRHRIAARMSPWGSQALNANFFLFGPKHATKSIVWQGFKIIGTHSNAFEAPRDPRRPKLPAGPKESMGAHPLGHPPKEPKRPPRTASLYYPLS